MGYFDDFLAKVPAEDQTILNKYPELKASVTKLEADLKTTSEFAGSWLNWQKDNWDADSNMTKKEKAMSDELTDAQARLAASVAGGASSQTVDQLRKEFEAKLADSQKQSLSAIEGMNHFYSAVSNRMLDHKDEFGATLKAPDLMAYMQANKINDPDIAYERMVAPRRSELAAEREKARDTKHAEEVAAAEQRGRELAAKEAAMGPGGSLPTDNTGGIAGVTSRIDAPAKISDEMKARITEAKPGDGSLAALGYEMFRRGEFATTQ